MPAAEMKIGSLGTVDVREGTYCYVGSAMNGLDQRISRHLSKEKKIRWHIDHLTIGCISAEAFESTRSGMTECDLGRAAEECGGTPVLNGFGCSDCRCKTHLFLLEGGAKERLCSRPFFAPYTQ